MLYHCLSFSEILDHNIPHAGIDDRGIVILCVSTKMEPQVPKDLIQGQANPLNSAFRLTYHMVGFCGR